VTREIATNLLLDKKDPSTNKSFRQVLMEISPEGKPGSMLFHTIDRQFKLDVIVNFQFHPDHASEANNLIAGLVPFLKDSRPAYHLKMFSPEAIQRQAKSKWDAERREAHSEFDIELQRLLTKDDDLNFTNEPTLQDEVNISDQQDKDPLVSIHIPDFPPEHMPTMRKEDDSVSTFHQGHTINLTEDSDNDDDKSENEDQISPSKIKLPVSILKTPRSQEPDTMSRNSLSNSASRISSLETELSAMDKAFRTEIGKLQEQAVSQAKPQLLHGTMLSEILSMLKKSTTIEEDFTFIQPEVASPPQVLDSGGSKGVACHG
jgi:hypothetical protein